MSDSMRVIPVSHDGKLQPSLRLVLIFFFLICLYFLNEKIKQSVKEPDYMHNQNLLLRNVGLYKAKREQGGA